MKFAAAWQKRARPVEMQQSRGQTDKNHKNTLFLSKRTCKTGRPPLSECLPKKVFSLENEWKNCRNDPREKEKKGAPLWPWGPN